MTLPLQVGECWEYRLPFRHYRATGVLTPEQYGRASTAFTEILETTEGKRSGPFRLLRGNQDYDALMLGMNEKLTASFAPFFVESWLRSLAAFMGFPFLPKIDGGLHSSPEGSRTGWIHTDYCSAWFDESEQTANHTLFPNRRNCDYFTGRILSPGAVPREYVRAVTMIYYLCNDGWTPGDGGETGLYGAAMQTSHTIISLVPPINNTMLIFECSPHSYHRFVANSRRRRNSLILWLHSTIEEAELRWGASVSRPAP